MDAQQFLKAFGHVANAPRGVDKLRELVFSLASDGKLIAHAEPVVPTNLNEVADFVMGQAPPSQECNAKGEGYVFVKTGEFGDVYPIVREWTTKPLKFAKQGDVLICVVGATVGKLNLAIDCAIGRSVAAIRPRGVLITEYLYFMLMPFTLRLRSGSRGSAQGVIGKAELAAVKIRVPSHGEQTRIVAKVNELMALCDKLEAQQQARRQLQNSLRQATLQAVASATSPHELQTTLARLAVNFGRLFQAPEDVADFRQLAMDLAVRGLLTEQQRDDEPASKLLERIAVEQQEQVLRGEVKRPKPLPDIKLDDAPFDLPPGWAWARFPEVGLFARGKSKHRPRNDPKLFNPGIYPLIQTGEVARAKSVISEFHSKYSDAGLAQSKMWPQGTLCITIAANIADSAILGFDACFPDSVVGFVPASEIRDDVDYFLLFMKTARSRLLAFAPSTAQKNINLDILQSVLVPIPPKNEIKRILTRIRAINALCDHLAGSLAKAQDAGRLLAEAAIASFTGITTTQVEEPMKAPQTELIAPLCLGQAPDIKAQAPLATILARHQGQMPAKDLWQRFGGEIDAFYAQLKAEVTHGWILEPAVAEVREVQAASAGA